MKNLTNDEYIAELNRRLQADPDYRDGTRFIAIPPEQQERARGGSTWVGPDDMLPVIVRIVKDTAGETRSSTPSWPSGADLRFARSPGIPLLAAVIATGQAAAVRWPGH